MKKIKKGAKKCQLSDLLFPVELRENPRKTNKEYSFVVTGKIDNEEWDLNYCSNVYALVKNEDIFPKIEEVLNDNKIAFKVTYRHINHVRFYADYVITDEKFAYKMEKTNDSISPVVRVQHSYNGLTKYKIDFGYFRVICSNGLTIPVEEMKEFNLSIVGKHTETIVHSFDRLDVMLKYFAENAANITERITRKYEVMGGRWIANPEERLTEVLEAVKITAVENSKFNTINDIMNRIMSEADNLSLGYNGRVNDWLIYNGINQYLNDDDINIAVPEVRQEKDLKVLEYMIQ